MYTGLFVLLVLFSLVLFVMAAIALRSYRSTEDKSRLNAALVTVVAGLLILSMNFVGVYPVIGYDSVRYTAELRGNETTTVILPFPNEYGLVEELEIIRGHATYHLVNSDKGMGLEVILGSYVYIEGHVKVKWDQVDYSADLDDGRNFWVHLNTTYDPAWFDIYEVRIIHQSPSDFHSKQIFTYRGDMEQGWNSIEWGIYRE